MARNEADREDLMRDATAFPRRGLWKLSDGTEVFVGFRDQGGFSVYFHQDPCFHFDAQRRLRRAFVGGFLFRTQGEFLARLKRHRSTTSTELRRVDLTIEQTRFFLSEMSKRLSELQTEIRNGTADLIDRIPTAETTALKDEVITACVHIEDCPQLAPAVPTKRQ